MNKTEIRRKILEQRLSLPDDKLLAVSESIQGHVLKSGHWPSRGRVGLYSSTKNEVLTHKLFQRGLEQGLHVYFPRVEQGLVYYEVNGPEDLQRGAWGILEPVKHCSALPEDEELDLIIVPGVVFSKDCHRVGYGRGFYDRVVGDLSQLCVGLAFDFQVVDEVPLDEWDRQLTSVVTELREYKPAS